jgi:hypothetical protein
VLDQLLPEEERVFPEQQGVGQAVLGQVEVPVIDVSCVLLIATLQTWQESHDRNDKGTDSGNETYSALVKRTTLVEGCYL